MSKLSIIKTTWGYLLGALAVLSFLATLYFELIYEKEASIKFEIISNIKVVDIHEELGKLDIIYDGISIKKNKESLSIISLRVINDGQIDILKSFYDENEPMGFIVSDGRIIDKPELVSYSDNYLKSNLKLISDSNSKVVFSNIILEKKQYFTVKIQIIHNQDASPEILPIGKIASIKQLVVTKPYIKENERSIWADIFDGKIYIQIIRIIAYTIILILLLVITIYPSLKLSKYLKKLSRKQKVLNFKKVADFEENKGTEYIFNSFVENELGYLIELKNILELPPERLKILLTKGLRELEKEEDKDDIENDLSEDYKKEIHRDIVHNGFQSEYHMSIPFYYFSRETISKEMREKEIIDIDPSGEIDINSSVVLVLKEFIKYIKSKS